MKINRRQLRRMILNEVFTLTEGAEAVKKRAQEKYPDNAIGVKKVTGGLPDKAKKAACKAAKAAGGKSGEKYDSMKDGSDLYIVCIMNK